MVLLRNLPIICFEVKIRKRLNPFSNWKEVSGSQTTAQEKAGVYFAISRYDSGKQSAKAKGVSIAHAFSIWLSVNF